ncbi:glucose-6-phosphate dehydrogenase [Microbacterium elymi]|uniref:Glucose-6-phosphate dehydrogenase n=1 Tax=Microbacterium elymi TaxID=2909587 RepID=A0ABY5NI09_9MICO|nr:glucose-6-phosphate dehydrogenase [Microbacterium elymi]UUT34820.1 glucose-6-phosphate dehydrogenase [Microbacterium elymi]
MKITRSSDWREAIPFETPMIADSVMPGEPARCTTCGIDSEPLARTQLWAVKHRHPHDPAGTVRLYCADHTPKTAAPVAAASAAARAPRERRTPARAASRAAPRAAQQAEKPAVVCPTCFVEVPPTGVCGMCGERVA